VYLKNVLGKFYLKYLKGLFLPRDLIKYALKKHHGRISIIYGKKKITCGRLYERAKKLANAFSGLGLQKGDRIAVFLRNCPEYFEIRAASYLSGAVLVPVVWDTGSGDLVFILNDCGIKLLFYHEDLPEEKRANIRKKTKIKYFVKVPKTGNPPGRGNDIAYEELLLKYAASEPQIELTGDDPASINFSSGTTGRPKGIKLLQKSWVNSFYNYVLNSTKTRREEFCVFHSLSLATAGGTAFLPALFLGAKNVIADKFDAKESVSLIMKNRVNNIFMSPGYFMPFLEYCKTANIKPALSNIIIGTEPMPGEKFKEAIEFFGPVVQEGYGMAEVLPPLCLLSPKDYMLPGGKVREGVLLSVGRPLKGVRIKILNEKIEKCPVGKIGKIAVKSSSVSCGYWNNPDLTRAHYKKGWFYSDDYGYFDSEGYLYIMGREKDILSRRGEKFVFAREVEEILHTHPYVSEACVLSGNDKKIRAFVSLKKEFPGFKPEELIKFCGDKTDKNAVPETVYIVPELPKNESGKIDRKKIRKSAII